MVVVVVHGGDDDEDDEDDDKNHEQEAFLRERTRSERVIMIASVRGIVV